MARKRLKRLFGLAAIGALVAWLMGRRRSSSTAPEGEWKELSVTDGSSESER